MANWFSGIGQAASGLSAARAGLAVVGQNMTNAATTGYVRQRSEQVAVASSSTGITTGSGALDGVAVTGTSRLTDPVLDARVRAEHARDSLASTASGQLAAVVTALGEPSDDGLSAQLSSFWNAWGQVSLNPSSDAARSVLLTAAGTVSATLQTMSAALTETTNGVTSALGQDATDLTTAAAQLAQVNGLVATAAATGAPTGTLLDQRDRLLDQLSSLAGVGVTLGANGAATVTLGGQPLVTGTTSATVAVAAGPGLTVDGTAVTVASGSAAARLAALTDTLPGYRAALDAVATGLMTTVNTAQSGGFDATGAPGAPLFAGTGAADLHVTTTDPGAVAASAVAGAADGSVAAALSQTALAPGSPDARFAALVGSVATAAAAAQQRATTQGAVTSYVDGLKSSMSGVSLDEEAASMLVYQQAFNASARVLTAIDAMLDTLINHTGQVGRA